MYVHTKYIYYRCMKTVDRYVRRCNKINHLRVYFVTQNITMIKFFGKMLLHIYMYIWNFKIILNKVKMQYQKLKLLQKNLFIRLLGI